MARFKTDREAKEYLVGQIAAEAEREGMPLAVVERKMLYYSKTGWTLPDMEEVQDAFERYHHQFEYEQKIAGLVHNLRSQRHDRNQEQSDAWDEAQRMLKGRNHYILSLISAGQHQGTRWFEVLKIWLTAAIALAATL
jgi:hypothetical protein